jgi:hypothetical protein
MAQYRCLNCGYDGGELICQFNDYTYCVASNEEDPEFIGDAEIGQPVGCPKCHAWGVDKFEEIE